MPMPTMNELSQVYGNWNPEAYLQGRQQVDLSNQFEQGRIQEQGQDIRAKELGNIFTEQNNPKRLQNQDLVNEGLGYTNRKSAVETRMAEGLEKYKLPAAQMEELKRMKQSDLDLADIEVKKMLRDPDPEVRKRGEQLWEFTDAVRAEKTKWDREMAKERYSQQQQTGRAVEGFQTQRYVADRGAASREAVASAKSTPTDFWSAYNKMKTARDKHSSLMAQAARVGPTHPEYQILMNMAEAIRPQAEAEIATVRPGGLDIGAATGMPVTPPPNIAPKGTAPKLPSGWTLKN